MDGARPLRKAPKIPVELASAALVRRRIARSGCFGDARLDVDIKNNAPLVLSSPRIDPTPNCL